MSECLRRTNDRLSAKPLGDNDRTDHWHAGRRVLSIAPGGSRSPALRHAARYGHRAGNGERRGVVGLLDFRESPGIWSHGDHAWGIRDRLCLWRIAGRLLERTDHRKTHVSFAGD